jgi:hypothetical protein
MARNSDARLLRHSRILETVRRKWTQAVAEQRNDDFIALLEKEMGKHERVLTGEDNITTSRLPRRW